MNLNQRLEMQDKTIAALYNAMSPGQRVVMNEKVIQMFATTLNPAIAESLIRVAKVQALEEMNILPPVMEEADA